MSKQVSIYILIEREHQEWLAWERMRLSSPIIDYIEDFYYKKLIHGSLTLVQVWEKLLGLDPRFPMSLKRHMFRHIRLKAERLRPPPPPPPKRDERREALLELLKDEKKKKVKFAQNSYAWVRDKHGRIHLVSLKAHKFARIHKSEKKIIRKHFIRQLKKLAAHEAERQINIAMRSMFKPAKRLTPEQRRVRTAMHALFREPKVKQRVKQQADKEITAAINAMFKEPKPVPRKPAPKLRERISQTVKKAISRISKLLRLPRRIGR